MKRIWIIVLTAALANLAGSQTVWAAKAEGPKAKFFEKYDKNHNGKIDDDEKDAVRKDYAANPDGDLKRFDKNHDGKLDDEEIARIKPPTGKGKAAGNDDVLAKYDKDHNGVIDGDEKDALRKDYAAKPDGDLKKFDKNNDGKLDDGEIAAIKSPAEKKHGGAKSKSEKAGSATDQAGPTSKKPDDQK